VPDRNQSPLPGPARRARDRVIGVALDIAEIAEYPLCPLGDLRALHAEMGRHLDAAARYEGEPHPDATPLDFILRLDEVIDIKRGGQVRTVKAWRTEYGDDGQPLGIRLVSLTGPELDTLAQEGGPAT
jgi:hypothetical protein